MSSAEFATVKILIQAVVDGEPPRTLGWAELAGDPDWYDLADLLRAIAQEMENT